MQNRYFDDPNLLAMRPMLVMKSFFFLSLSTSENSLHFNFSSLVTKKDKKDFFLVGEGSEALSHIYFSLNGSISIYFHLPLPIFAFLVSRFLAPTHNFWRERLRKKMQIPFSRNENFFSCTHFGDGSLTWYKMYIRRNRDGAQKKKLFITRIGLTMAMLMAGHGRRPPAAAAPIYSSYCLCMKQKPNNFSETS